MLLTLKDKHDINLVEKYNNMYIYKDENDIEELEEGYYYDELIGLDVYVNNEKKGKVINVEEGVRNNFIRVKTEDKEVLIPYIEQFILNTDLEENRIDVINMEGLF